MSMWLNLAKVSPELLARIRAQPDLLDAIFFDEEPIAGLDPRSDVLGCDYLTLSAVADAMAAEAEPGSDWRERYMWLPMATGEGDAEPIGDYEFTYGGAFAIPAEDVPGVHDGLIAEGWTFDGPNFDGPNFDGLGEVAEDDGDGAGDDDDADDEDEPLYDDFVDLVPFFAAAAREGKAVVGGVS